MKSKLTKKGNTTYYMTAKKDDDCVKKTPQGYEVFESYDTGIMYVRKIKKKLFKEDEIRLIQSKLKNNKTIADFRLDINGNQIKIYVFEQAETEDKNKDGLFAPFFKVNMFVSRFEEKMRIYVEETKNTRAFELERYCYRGSIDDWITIDWDEKLENIVEKLIHLGKESYYDLI